ncbi:MAG: serine/threonine protein kinase [Gemmatimonadetes bacterium]|nr:serine/threonine protein kinase [Gemmatimonadota bacterium]
MADIFDRLKTALADRYAIEREIGAGGMATVYLAEDLKHHRKVAVKVLRPELAAAIGPERFLREIEIAAQLHHPHILPLYDSGESQGFLYYVMPYEEGQSLRDRLAREGELPITEAVRILRDVVDALSSAHEHGVVHRDIKPANLVVNENDIVKILDLGLARLDDDDEVASLTIENSENVMGTADYLAPEP